MYAQYAYFNHKTLLCIGFGHNFHISETDTPLLSGVKRPTSICSCVFLMVVELPRLSSDLDSSEVGHTSNLFHFHVFLALSLLFLFCLLFCVFVCFVGSECDDSKD